MAALKSILSIRVSKWMRHRLLSWQSSCKEAAARHIQKIPGLGFVFQHDGALVNRADNTVAFLERKVPDFVSPTLWLPNSPELNPDDYSIWSVGLRQKKVYRSRITNVNELEMRLIDEWGSFNQSIVDAAIAARGQAFSFETGHFWPV